MTLRRHLAGCAGIAVFLIAGLWAVDTAAQPQPVAPITWESTGDSYSSGEGIYNDDGPCQQSPDAYGPAAVVLLDEDAAFDWVFGPTAFTACTGHKLENYFFDHGSGSLRNWRLQQGLPERVDVITMSMGGNDIGFGAILDDCFDVGFRQDFEWSSFTDLVQAGARLSIEGPAGDLLRGGCDVSQQELEDRIDALLRPRSACDTTRWTDPTTYECDLNLGDGQRGSLIDFYKKVAATQLTDRGMLYVVGYPAIVAPVDEWPGNPALRISCQEIKRGDSEKLERVTTYLNEQLAEAVASANSAIGQQRIVFVDRQADFRQAKAELCGSNATDWMNGLDSYPENTGRAPIDRLRDMDAYHPNLFGHQSTARQLAATVKATFPFQEGRTDAAPPLSEEILLIELLDATLPAAFCGDSNFGWWAGYPIPLVGGNGESVAPDGSFGGASAANFEVEGYVDIDSDGRLDAVVSAECFGTTFEQCCAGRASRSRFVGALSVVPGTATQLELATPILTGFSPDTDRLILSSTLEGNEIITIESVIYPESAPPLAHDPLQPVSITNKYRDGQWVSRFQAEEPQPNTRANALPWLLVNGIADLKFDASGTADAEQTLDPVFGRGESSSAQCPSGSDEVISWGALRLVFRNDRLQGWTYDGRFQVEPRLETPSGVQIGMGEDAIVEIYRGVDVDNTSLGREFFFTVPAGTMSGLIDNGTVTYLKAGDACVFR